MVFRVWFELGGMAGAATVATDSATAAVRSYSRDVGLDIVSALSASFLVSPFIAIVDRGIMQNASGVLKVRFERRRMLTLLSHSLTDP